jgi:methyltransferase
VTRGPYRFLRHPNYVAVIGELISGALMTGAAVSGSLAVVLFGMLISRRISVEDEALASSARHPPCSL